MSLAILTATAIDAPALLDAVRSGRNGGYVSFAGDVRDHDGDLSVSQIDYVAYEPLARKELQRIGDEAERRWPGTLCAIGHRIGVLVVGETSVFIAVGAPHRAEAFDACRWIIDRLKVDVPIWKREEMPAGDAVWIEGSRSVAASAKTEQHREDPESS